MDAVELSTEADARRSIFLRRQAIQLAAMISAQLPADPAEAHQLFNMAKEMVLRALGSA